MSKNIFYATICSLILIPTAYATGSFRYGADEWKFVAKESRTGVSFYVAPTAVKSNGNTRIAYVIQDLPKPDPEGDSSYLLKVEYDCAKQRQRFLSAAFNNKPKMQGNLTGNNTSVGPWKERLGNDTGIGTVFSYVCSLK